MRQVLLGLVNFSNFIDNLSRVIDIILPAALWPWD